MKHNKYIKSSLELLTQTKIRRHNMTSAQEQTCTLPGYALHLQLQVFLIVLQVMDKLLKGQLVVGGAFFSFQGFLKLKFAGKPINTNRPAR